MTPTTQIRELIKTKFNIDTTDYTRLDVYNVADGTYHVKISNPSSKLTTRRFNKSYILDPALTAAKLAVEYKQKTMWLKIDNVLGKPDKSSHYATIEWRTKLLSDLEISKDQYSSFYTDRIVGGKTLYIRKYVGKTPDELRDILKVMYPDINSNVTLSTAGTLGISQYDGELRTSHPSASKEFQEKVVEFIRFDLQLSTAVKRIQELKNGFTTTIVDNTRTANDIVNAAVKSNKFNDYIITGYSKPTGVVLNFRKN